jgi:hypothetical protein
MQITDNFGRLNGGDVYSFSKLFSEAEIRDAKWFITQLYDRDQLVRLVVDLGGAEDMVRCHEDDAGGNVHWWAIVPMFGHAMIDA